MTQLHTVAALSTPPGKGGVAIIRISGEDALAVADAVFRPASGRALSSYPARSAVYGSILSGNEVLDTGIATLFVSPHSFTGEDTVEIACHGGILLSGAVLEAVLACGAEAAGPGEFTKRAFVNGKLSLTEAEAVIDLIDAESESQMRLASSNARGRLSAEIDAISADLRRLIASTYAFIDYPDEDLTDVSVAEMKAETARLHDAVCALSASYRAGRAIKEGVRTVLCGKPNTGKSSLLNLLLGTERAIVTDIPGTTRDTIEESVPLGHVMLRISDTAGIRQTEDAIEAIGVRRSLDQLEKADLILALFDASAPLDEADAAVLSHIARMRHARVIYLLTKTDRGLVLSAQDFPKGQTVLPISVRADGQNAKNRLCALVEAAFDAGDLNPGTDAIVTDARQFASLTRAAESLSSALAALEAGMSQDIAGMDLELALSHLALTDGRGAGDEIVSEIFSRFCVGK